MARIELKPAATRQQPIRAPNLRCKARLLGCEGLPGERKRCTPPFPESGAVPQTARSRLPRLNLLMLASIRKVWTLPYVFGLAFALRWES